MILFIVELSFWWNRESCSVRWFVQVSCCWRMFSCFPFCMRAHRFLLWKLAGASVIDGSSYVLRPTSLSLSLYDKISIPEYFDESNSLVLWERERIGLRSQIRTLLFPQPAVHSIFANSLVNFQRHFHWSRYKNVNDKKKKLTFRAFQQFLPHQPAREDKEIPGQYKYQWILSRSRKLSIQSKNYNRQSIRKSYEFIMNTREMVRNHLYSYDSTIINFIDDYNWVTDCW